MKPVIGPRFQSRVCWYCGKPGGTTAIYNAYWHPKCWRKATDEEKEQAKKDTENDPNRLRAKDEES